MTRRLSAIVVVLIAALLSGGGIVYYGSGSGGVPTFPLTGGLGCTTPAYSFAGNTAEGLCSNGANSIGIQTAAAAPANSAYIFMSNTQAIMDFRDASNLANAVRGITDAVQVSSHNVVIFTVDGVNKGFNLIAVTFTNLGTPANGNFAYCSDCTIANPCASGGNGALAKRLNSAWVCN